MSFSHDLQRHLHHLSDLSQGEADIDWSSDWGYLTLVLIITLLIGPVLLLAWWMQHWNAASPWDHEDRWAGTKQFAITLIILIYVPLLLNLVFFHVPLVPFWPHRLLVTVWYHLILWWAALLPLTPTLALVSERIDRRTRKLERVLLPSEQPPPQLAVTVGHVQATKSARKRKEATDGADSTQAAPKKRKKGRPVPLGQLLLEEQAARQAEQAHIHQLPHLPEASAASSPPEPPPKKHDRGTSESLKDIF
jgi:uncharacterized Tic20 family protein